MGGHEQCIHRFRFTIGSNLTTASNLHNRTNRIAAITILVGLAVDCNLTSHSLKLSWNIGFKHGCKYNKSRINASNTAIWIRIDMHATFDRVKIYWKCFEKTNRPAGKNRIKMKYGKANMILPGYCLTQLPCIHCLSTKSSFLDIWIVVCSGGFSIVKMNGSFIIKLSIVRKKIQLLELSICFTSETYSDRHLHWRSTEHTEHPILCASMSILSFKMKKTTINNSNSSQNLWWF